MAVPRDTSPLSSRRDRAWRASRSPPAAGRRLTARGNAGSTAALGLRRVPRTSQYAGPARQQEACLPGARPRRWAGARRAGGSPAALYPEPRSGGRSGSGAARPVGELSPSRPRLPARRPHPPGSRPRGGRAASAEGAVPPRRARSVCFPCPTDVSQNIGHMFSGNKLGMSANTLGLRWLFQLPHGRLGGGGYHLALALTPQKGG